MVTYRPFLVIAWVLACAIFPKHIAQAAKTQDLLDELNPAQLAIVRDGGRVMITSTTSGQPWPSVKVYQIIAALPEPVIAVFFDYETAHTYVPHVLQSTITKRVNSRICDIYYRMSIPLMPEEKYTVRNSLRTLPGGIYEIDWKLLQATTTRISEGSFRIQAYGKKQSIFCYSNLVVPGSRMAIVLRGLALEQVQKNIDALITQVDKQINQNPQSLQHQIAVLRKALAEVPNHP